MAAGFLLALTMAASCDPPIRIESSTLATVGTIEPVLFVVYRLNTSAEFAESLRQSLLSEGSRRGIHTRAIVMTGTELDEEETIHSAMGGMHGVVVLRPRGGSLKNGRLMYLLYAVNAYKLVSPSDHGRVRVWRGLVDAYNERTKQEMLHLLARELIERLIRDGVLPREEHRGGDE